MNRVATFVHISDLHFGPVDLKTRDSREPRAAELHRVFDGLLGHGYLSLCRLERFWAGLAEESPRLIVTGDLTSCGNTDEFETAVAFLADQLVPPRGNYVGLSHPNWKDLGISGNHDNWPGKPTVLGGPPAAKAQVFRTMPYFDRHVLTVGDGYTLSFLGIDTDADVGPRSYRRLLAQGAFHSQLAQLDGELNNFLVEPKEFRVLLLHHSSQYPGTTALKIVPKSLAALYDFAAKHSISVLLCGHTHVPCLKQFRVPYAGNSIPLFEACCGATTLRRSFAFDASDWHGGRPERRDWLSNSLLVHRVFVEGGRAALEWRTEVFVEGRDGFSRPSNVPAHIPMETAVRLNSR